MKILVANGHPLMRRGIAGVLGRGMPDARIEEVATTQATVAAVGSASWDVLILDVFLPGRGGLEVLGEVRRVAPGLPVLVLGLGTDEQLAVRVLRAGAQAVLDSRAQPEELIEAVRSLAAGRRYVTRSVAERLAGAWQFERWPPHERLSDREFHVMHLTIEGRSIREIADELSLSAKTVSTFHARVWKKLGVTSDVALLRYALEHGLWEPSRPSDARAWDANRAPEHAALGPA